MRPTPHPPEVSTIRSTPPLSLRPFRHRRRLCERCRSVERESTARAGEEARLPTRWTTNNKSRRHRDIAATNQDLRGNRRTSPSLHQAVRATWCKRPERLPSPRGPCDGHGRFRFVRKDPSPRRTVGRPTLSPRRECCHGSTGKGRLDSAPHAFAVSRLCDQFAVDPRLRPLRPHQDRRPLFEVGDDQIQGTVGIKIATRTAASHPRRRKRRSAEEGCVRESLPSVVSVEDRLLAKRRLERVVHDMSVQHREVGPTIDVEVGQGRTERHRQPCRPTQSAAGRGVIVEAIASPS